MKTKFDHREAANLNLCCMARCEALRGYDTRTIARRSARPTREANKKYGWRCAAWKATLCSDERIAGESTAKRYSPIRGAQHAQNLPHLLLARLGGVEQLRFDPGGHLLEALALPGREVEGGGGSGACVEVGVRA